MTTKADPVGTLLVFRPVWRNLGSERRMSGSAALRWALFAACWVSSLLLGAQAHSGLPASTVPVALRFSATEANSPPGSCGCFFLLGGAADIALPLHRAFSVDVEVAGQHAGSVPGTVRGLSTITLLAGPRYRVRLPRLQSVFAQALFGAARGFDAEFRRGDNAVDTATAFGYAVGGGYELPLTSSLTLRPVQLDYAQTNLPNGSDNRQRNISVGDWLLFQLGSLGVRR